MEARRRTLLLPLLLAAALPAAASGDDGVGAGDLARAAYRLCRQADRLPGSERRETLERGLALAERAVDANDRSARAHFAVFCTLGKLTELDGIGWRTLGAVRRVRREAERAVELDPHDVDALVGRGVMLLRLPRLLGGDEAEAERCFERALALDPWNAIARAHLERLHDGEPADETPEAGDDLLSARGRD